MGMYTQMYLKGIVKPEFRDAIQQVIDFNEEDYYKYNDNNNVFMSALDASVAWMAPKIDLFTNFAQVPRSCFILKDDITFFNKETGELEFVNDIKNYNSTYESFISLATKIMESVDQCTTHYEEDDWTTSYIFNKNDGSDDLSFFSVESNFPEKDEEYFYNINNDELYYHFMRTGEICTDK